MTVEDEITAALQQLAARAPDPQTVRSGMAARARVQRQRRALLTAGAAVAASGAIGLPVVLLQRSGSTAEAADVRTPPNLGPAVPEPAAGTGNTRVLMRYRVTWLPEEFVETTRTVTVSGGRPDYQLRQWSPMSGIERNDDPTSEGPPFIRLMLVPAREWPIGDWRIPVTINGVRGGKSPDDIPSLPQVMWPVADDLHLAVMVHGVSDSARIAELVARSVEPDRVAGVEASLQFGWLSASIAGSQRFTVSNVTSSWNAALHIVDNGTERARAEIGPAVSAPGLDGATTLTVRGLEAVVHGFPTGGGWVYARTDDGLGLSVLVGPPFEGPPAALDDVVRIAEELRIGPQPYVGWIGQR